MISAVLVSLLDEFLYYTFIRYIEIQGSTDCNCISLSTITDFIFPAIVCDFHLLV